MPGTDGTPYVVGTPHPNSDATAAFEFKPPNIGSGGRGGGYARWRSWEFRPETPGTSKEDVYVAVHRLAAVAWCFPDDWDAADILDSEALVGADVHHELDMPSANIEGELSVVEHGDHSSITQAEMRAYAADARRASEEATTQSSRRETNRLCARCGGETETRCTWEGFDGEVCPECAAEVAPDASIEVV